MPSAPTNLNAVKIEISDDETASLTGINYNDLRAVLTAASLERYNSPFKPKPLSGREDEETHVANVEGARWHALRGAIIDVLEARMQQAISPQYAPGIERIEHIVSSHNRNLLRLDAEMREAEENMATTTLAAQTTTVAVDPLDEVRARLTDVIEQAGAALRLVTGGAVAT